MAPASLIFRLDKNAVSAYTSSNDSSSPIICLRVTIRQEKWDCNMRNSFQPDLLPSISLFNIINILHFVLGAALLTSKLTFEYTSPVLLYTYIIIVSNIK